MGFRWHGSSDENKRSGLYEKDSKNSFDLVNVAMLGVGIVLWKSRNGSKNRLKVARERMREREDVRGTKRSQVHQIVNSRSSETQIEDTQR